MKMVLKIFKLALSYLKYNRLMSCVIIVCITISIFLPLFTIRISNLARAILTERAQQTPLVVGRKGSPLQLVLNTLYFKSDTPDVLKFSVYTDIARKKAGVVVPVYNRHTARNYPIIGTTLQYFKVRGLEIHSGATLQLLGDALLGYNAAKNLKLKQGDILISDTKSLYNISSMYPLQMNITGVLEKSNSPDDNVVFVDFKTAWVMDGICHGHKDLRKAEALDVLAREKDNVVGSPSVYEFTKITPENIDSFHFHGDESEFPLTGIIVIPETEKKGTILKANLNLTETLQAVAPGSVIGQLIDLVFNIRKIMSAYFLLVFISTALFLFLIVVLSLQIRKNERQIMQIVGGGRNTIFILLFTQLFTIVVISFVVSMVLVNLLVLIIKHLQFI